MGEALERLAMKAEDVRLLEQAAWKAVEEERVALENASMLAREAEANRARSTERAARENARAAREKVWAARENGSMAREDVLARRRRAVDWLAFELAQMSFEDCRSKKYSKELSHEAFELRRMRVEDVDSLKTRTKDELK